jgi:hypothetical protein
MRKFCVAGVVCGILFIAAAAYLHHTREVRAADHRDSPTADANPEGDITDVFAFIDRNDTSQIVLVMNVNPFSVPAELPTYGFSPEFLYQFKFAGDRDAEESQVIQAVFLNVPTTECASGQRIRVYGPGRPQRLGQRNVLLRSQPTATGCTNTNFTQGNFKVFTGQRDDPFVTDVSQLFRIRNGSQDVYRAFDSPALGAVRGRIVRSDGTSGIDGFGGFNVSSIILELPKSEIRGTGFLNNQHLVGVWGTVSMQDQTGNGRTFTQFQRMGQQLFKTIFVPTDQREAFNLSQPVDDMKNWASLVPDSLTTTDNDGTGNTIANRAALLTTIGVTQAPNGAPLLLPSDFANTSKDLILNALLPDVLRLDLDRDPSDLAVGQFGLQNGRRPADNVTEILMRVARQLADVKFPDGSKLPGSGAKGSRKPLDCSTLPGCPDRRVLVVLQGTQFLKPDSQLGDLTTSGNDRTLLLQFPFLAEPHPLPGDANTVGFPAQK